MPNTPKLSESQQEELLQQYNDGAPVAALVAHFGVSASTVRATVRRAGGELRPVGRPKTSTD